MARHRNLRYFGVAGGAWLAILCSAVETLPDHAVPGRAGRVTRQPTPASSQSIESQPSPLPEFWPAHDIIEVLGDAADVDGLAPYELLFPEFWPADDIVDVRGDAERPGVNGLARYELSWVPWTLSGSPGRMLAAEDAGAPRNMVNTPALPDAAQLPPPVMTAVRTGPVPGLVRAGADGSSTSTFSPTTRAVAIEPAGATMVNASAQMPRPAATASSSSAGDTPSAAGWTPFVLKKSVEELADVQRQEVPRPAPQIRLPPGQDILHLTTGVSHLESADWGLVATGSGLLFGRQADFSTFLTAGPLGVLTRSARVFLFDPVQNTQIEGGELYSDLRGSSRGARFMWRSNSSQPSISLYVHEEGSPEPTVLSYRQQFDLGKALRIGGEIDSNGSGFVRAQYTGARLDTGFYYRYRPDWAGRDTGLSTTLNAGLGISLSAATTFSEVGVETSTWNTARIRVPLPGAAAVSYEQSWVSAESERTVSAVLLQVPFKSVQILQRVQFGHTEFMQRGVPVGFDGRQSQTAGNFTPGLWGTFAYQQSTQWFDNDRARQWDEVSTTLKLGRKTSLQAVTALPDMLNPQRLRARVRQELGARLSLEVQYGMLSAFQLTRAATPDERPTLMVTFNKIWDVRTPARGGLIRGQVLDQAQRPVSEVPVKLGPYRTVTDESGRYEFTRVPSGQFDVSLDKEKLPVQYASEDAAQTVTITTTTSQTVDFAVMPLNAIRGRAYIDRNRNNAFDAGEGVAGIPVAIGTWITATDATGAFAFYNQPPGTYVVRLDLAHLRTDLVPASDAELDVELPVDRPLVGLEFRLQPKVRPILMQTLP